MSYTIVLEEVFIALYLNGYPFIIQVEFFYLHMLLWFFCPYSSIHNVLLF